MFARHPRYHVHFTPTSGSWLNLVERLFAEVTERCLRREGRTTARALEKAMLDYLDQRNREPRPFSQTASADLILGRVEKLCKQISDSGHSAVDVFEMRRSEFTRRPNRLVSIPAAVRKEVLLVDDKEAGQG